MSLERALENGGQCPPYKFDMTSIFDYECCVPVALHFLHKIQFARSAIGRQYSPFRSRFHHMPFSRLVSTSVN